MKKNNFDLEAAKEASKAFLNAERSSGFPNFSQQQPEMHQPADCSTIQDLIKCFCGVCESFFKRHSIEYALKANGEELLRDLEAREVLKKFLIFRKGSLQLKSPAEEIVECFELVEAILQGKKDLEEVKDELEELLFTEYWEDMLTSAIDEGTQAINDFLHDLMRECATRLENTNDFPLLKTELAKKLGK